jgi:hypothetical protein
MTKYKHIPTGYEYKLHQNGFYKAKHHGFVPTHIVESGGKDWEKIEPDSPFESVNLLRKFLIEEPEKVKQIIEEFQSTYVEPTGGMGLEEPEEKEYEILRRKQNTISAHKNSFGLCIDPIPGEILSVKRLSDGEVFELGQKKIYSVTKETLTIKSFSTSSNGSLYVNFEEGEHGGLSDLQPLPERTPLFRSEDGVDIYEGDWSFHVDKTLAIGRMQVRADEPRIKWKYFSTMEAAQEYVINNKPVFTLKESYNPWLLREEARKRCGFTPEEAKKREGI